jgi:hypothetical protein
MLGLAKPNAMSPALQRDELSLADILAAARAHAGEALVFSYEGRDVRPGYHVTEVKSGAFSAIDCGANPESWNEVFVQLWDVQEERDRTHMRAGKFVAIMDKVQDQVALDPASKLTFEVSDGIAAMQLFKASDIAVDTDVMRVKLDRRAASCKPRDRWLETQPASCCAPAQAKSRCC